MTGEKPVLLREFCAENMTCVPASVAAGARRIELCDNLAVGGTTPSAGVIAAAVGFCRPRGVGVMCMVRPRGGDFEYTPEEASIMRADLALAKRAGVTGVVFGCLSGGRLDRELTSELVALAHGSTPDAPGRVDVTFHMAFDALPESEQLEAIDHLADLGVERILTYGGPAGSPIESNLPRLAAYVDCASGRIGILPGGGITWQNAETVARVLGVSEVHGTRIVKMGGEVMAAIPADATLDEVRAVFAGDNFVSGALGAQILEAGAGHAVCAFDLQERHLNEKGGVMGGAIFSLGDFAIVVAATVGAPSTVSVAFNINFMTAPRGSRLIATADEDKRGRALGFYTCLIEDDLGTPVARLTGTVMHVGDRASDK